jgi:hypothetical protein
MPAARSKVLLPLVGIFLFLSAVSTSFAAPQHHSRKHPAKTQPAPVVQPAPQPVPLRPEQMPAVAPQVSYQQNQLIIIAQNSTLSDILRAVRNQTGAAVDFPANATERVVGHFGPGPARDVLAAMLNGSHFDYVMLGSAANPSAVERIILTSKTGSAPDAPTYQAAAPPQGGPQPGLGAGLEQQQEAVQEVAEDDFSTLDDANADDDQSPDQQPAQAEGQVPPNVQPGVKTPEQFLQELQRQQQQQQQLVPGQPVQPGPNGLPPGAPIPPNQQPQEPPQ